MSQQLLQFILQGYAGVNITVNLRNGNNLNGEVLASNNNNNSFLAIRNAGIIYQINPDAIQFFF